MVKRTSGVTMPSGQGGLIGGVSTTYKTRFEFSPKLVIYFSLLVVVFIFVLSNMNWKHGIKNKNREGYLFSIGEMIPGINPRQVQQMMRQMGMSQEDIDASEVVIKTTKGNLVFRNPSVQKITMQGQATFQLSGSYEIEQPKVEVVISDEDIEMVCSSANVSKAQAKSALEKSNGDIAQAIVDLQG